MAVRFAPSPTGSFHMGNLRTAWISHWWARHLGLPWVLRFEDIDRPRVVAGAQAAQLADMKTLGLEPDEIVVQSDRGERHLALFSRAREEGQVYPCVCSRREVLDALQGAASAPHGEPSQYNGRCRDRADWPAVTHPTIAWRFRADEPSGHHDFIVGRTSPISSRSQLPDLRSFVSSYNWACAIDDSDGSYRLLVRAYDLEHVLVSQRAVQLWMKGSLPSVFHCAIVNDYQGERLEKRKQGTTLAERFAMGETAELVAARFAKSFVAPPADLSTGASWGEKARQVSLLEMGFPQGKT